MECADGDPRDHLQVLSLQEHMAQGLDASLLYCYASLMALNAFVVFYHTQFRWNQPVLQHILKDSIIDAAFAVFFPVLILLYSVFVFQGNLKTVKIRQQFFPPRIFERKACNYVSAEEMNMFSTDFEIDLQLTRVSALDPNYCGSSQAGAQIFSQTTRELLSLQKPTGGQLTTTMNQNGKSVTPLCPVDVAQPGAAVNQFVKNDHPPRSCLRTMVGFSFLVWGVGCIVYTIVAVRISRSLCSSYPECVQFAHQWFPGESNIACGCLAYVDRELAPASIENLTDVTQKLANLASAGKLQTIQLVNRKINGSLPDELQTCQGLRNLVLIHTGVEIFPTWTSTTFSEVEYLHVEGDASDINLTELPSDLFALMTSLHTIHLSYLGLKSLESVYFGFLDSITEPPSMGGLPAIQVLALESLPQIRVFPDVEQYEDTLEMVFIQDSPTCCSGFLQGGDCNTIFLNCCERHSSDSSNDETLPPACLVMPDESSFLPTNTTLAVISRFAGNVSNFCDPAQATCPYAYKLKSILIPEDVCVGVLYRECTSEDEGAGICFNEDMGRVQCLHSQTTIEMRRAEIDAGSSCDKVEEKWLGCA